MTLDLRRLDEMPRAELIALATQFGIERPERMTRMELKDELVRVSITDAALRERSRGWLGVARDLVASVVEAGLHMPDAAKVIRGDVQRIDAAPRRPPVATVTLAEIYAAQGHGRRALKMLEQVLEKEPDHEVARALKEQLLAQGATDSPREPGAPLERAALGVRLNLADVVPGVPTERSVGGADWRTAPIDPAPHAASDSEPPLSEMPPLSVEAPLSEMPPLSVEAPPREVPPSWVEAAPPEMPPLSAEVPPREVPPPAAVVTPEAPVHEEAPPLAASVQVPEPLPPSELAPEAAWPAEVVWLSETVPASEELWAPEVVPVAEAVANAEAAPVDEAAPAAPPSRPRAPGQAWVVILHRDGEPYVVWHVDPDFAEFYRAAHDGSALALKVVGVESSWDGVERHELDLPVAAPAGKQALPALARTPWIRAALGIRLGSSFRPLVVGIEASADGMTFRPHGVTAQFAQGVIERARGMAAPD